MDLKQALENSSGIVTTSTQDFSLLDYLISVEDSKLEYDEMLERHRELDLITKAIPSYFSNEDTGYFDYSDEAMNPILKVALVLVGGAIGMYISRLILQKEASSKIKNFDIKNMTEKARTRTREELDDIIRERKNTNEKNHADEMKRWSAEAEKLFRESQPDVGSLTFLTSVPVEKLADETIKKHPEIKDLVKTNDLKAPEKELSILEKLIVKLFGIGLLRYNVHKIEDLTELIKYLELWLSTDISKVTSLIDEIITAKNNDAIIKIMQKNVFPEHIIVAKNLWDYHYFQSTIFGQGGLLQDSLKDKTFICITNVRTSMDIMFTTNPSNFGYERYRSTVNIETVREKVKLDPIYSASPLYIGSVIKKLTSTKAQYNSPKIKVSLGKGKKFLESNSNGPVHNRELVNEKIQAIKFCTEIFERFDSALTDTKKDMAAIVQLIEKKYKK